MNTGSGTNTSYWTSRLASLAIASSIVSNVLIWTLTPYFFSNALTTSGLMYCCQL